MSEAMVFDTHENFKRLVDAGVPEKQAEAIIKCQSASQSELATKMDIARLEASTKADIVRLETAMAKLEMRLIKWVVGTAGIVVALIKLLPAF